MTKCCILLALFACGCENKTAPQTGSVPTSANSAPQAPAAVVETIPKMDIAPDLASTVRLTNCHLASMHFECKLENVGKSSLRGWPVGDVDGPRIKVVLYKPDDVKDAEQPGEYSDVKPGEAVTFKFGTVGPDDHYVRAALSFE